MKLRSSLTAFAAFASLALAAGAQTLSTTASDLLLGFRASSGTGSSSNLEVDLGAFTSFTSDGSYADGALHLIGNLSAADLSDTYGASWNSRSDLTWGIVGTTGNALSGFTVFASKMEATAGVQSDAYDSRSKATLNSAATAINPAISNLSGLATTANSSFATVVASSDSISWSHFQASTPGISFNTFDTDGIFENNTNFSSGYIVSDLYKLSANTVAYVGSFALASDGKLYYSSSAASFSAVPEPSTYAAILGVAVLGFVAVRRRRQARLVAAA